MDYLILQDKKLEIEWRGQTPLSTAVENMSVWAGASFKFRLPDPKAVAGHDSLYPADPNIKTPFIMFSYKPGMDLVHGCK